MPLSTRTGGCGRGNVSGGQGGGLVCVLLRRKLLGQSRFIRSSLIEDLTKELVWPWEACAGGEEVWKQGPRGQDPESVFTFSGTAIAFSCYPTASRRAGCSSPCVFLSNCPESLLKL